MIPQLLCTICKTEISWNDRYCPGCGAPVDFPGGSSFTLSGTAVVCTTCGETNSGDAGYCSSCGAPLGGAGKRKDRPSPSRKETKAPRTLSSGRLVVGLAVFLVGGLIVLELATGRKNVPQQVAHQHEEPAANMQALPQIEELEKQVAAHPHDASLMLRLANTLHDNRFFDRAIAYYTQYLALNPKDTDARVDLGICYNDSGNKDEAIRQIKEAIKNDPKHVLAHFNLGIIHLQARDVEEAAVWFKKTIELAPGSEAAERARRLLTQHSAPSQSTTN